MLTANIFISYRREDSRHQAGRLYDHLVGQFGKEHVFKDVDSIPLGSDFRQILTEQVAASDVFLAVIGDAWHSMAGKDGLRRLDDPGDFVRIEIEAALGCNIPVIPVFVGNSPVPQAEQLPESLRELSFRNGLPVRPDPDFHHDMDRLIRGIEAAVSGSPRRKPRRVRRVGLAATLAVLGTLLLATTVYVTSNKVGKLAANVPKGAADKEPVRPDPKVRDTGGPGAGPARSSAGEPPASPANAPSLRKESTSPTVLETKNAKEEFQPLFNGKDLSGWRVLGNPTHPWKVDDGVLEGSGGPRGGSSLATERSDFANFHLRVETKLAEGLNTGIQFRVTETDAGAAWYLAYIAGTDQGEEDTGCLRFHAHKRDNPNAHGLTITLARADPVVPIRKGQWFVEEVIADGDVITVLVQGIEVARFKTLDRKLKSGPIRIVARSNSRVVVRKVEIKELSGTGLGGSPESGFDSEKVPDSIDWDRVPEITGNGNWHIEKNELAQTAHKSLACLNFGDGKWADYSFSADVRIEQNTSGVGLAFRGVYWYATDGPADNNPEHGSICRWLPSADPPFSVLPTRRSQDALLTPGRWHRMRIDVNGKRFDAYLDNRFVFSASDAAAARGKVGFRANDPCRIRNVKITAPDGKILWQDLPVVLTATSFGVPLKGLNP
jgi:hypothetical protein